MRKEGLNGASETTGRASDVAERFVEAAERVSKAAGRPQSSESRRGSWKSLGSVPGLGRASEVNIESWEGLRGSW